MTIKAILFDVDGTLSPARLVRYEITLQATVRLTDI
jgi:FMN phosphatase YigB (HAD superfamily)